MLSAHNLCGAYERSFAFYRGYPAIQWESDSCPSKLFQICEEVTNVRALFDFPSQARHALDQPQVRNEPCALLRFAPRLLTSWVEAFSRTSSRYSLRCSLTTGGSYRLHKIRKNCSSYSSLLELSFAPMSAFIPPPRHPRRPHLPSPRLEIPSASSGPSSSGIRTPSSSSDDGTGSSSAGSSTAQIPARARAGRPRLSLPSTSTTSRSDIHAGPAGLEHLSLDEGDRTMRPGEMQSPIPPISRPPPSNKPKLGLQTSRTPSPMPALSGPSDSNNYTSSVSLASDSMVRSTSFEGALFAETSQANIRGDEYRLSPDTLEDLGRLGEGASGEVRKVLHAPSGTVMAKKVQDKLCLVM